MSKDWKCDFCGRPLTRQIKAYGHIYCPKHYRQFKKYGKVLDNNPRTIYDKNEIHVKGKIAFVDLYNKNCEVIAQAIIDTEDIPKIKYTKWKLSGSGYAMNTPKFKGGSKHMSRVILGVDTFVDHINHNTLDNRKKNLRVVSKSQNQMNVNYRGVDNRGDGRWIARIKKNGKMVYLGTYVFEEEAYFARWYAEKLVFKQYRFPKPKPVILPDREKMIKKYVREKVQRL
jgi:hypothetical protein